jgi:hypothetical protein
MERVMAILFVLGVIMLTPLAAWVAYLVFCRWLVKETHNAEDLRHAANAAKAFRGAAPAAIAQVLIKFISLWHGKGG